MPDWFYRTVSQRVLFALSPQRARDFALGMMGGLSRLPGGKYVIDLLGHMVPDARLTVRKSGLSFWTPVGFGIGLDMLATAPKALARFGVGVIEVGPIGIAAMTLSSLDRDPKARTLIWRGQHRLSIEDAVKRLPLRRDRRVLILARLEAPDAKVFHTLIRALGPRISAISVEVAANADDPLLQVRAAVAAADGLPVIAVIPAGRPVTELAACLDMARAALDAGCAGLLIDDTALASGDRRFGPVSVVDGDQPTCGTIATVRHLRTALGVDCLILATGGIEEPADALDATSEGADVVLVDSGLVFGGPGLVKRIDDALMHRQLTKGQVVPIDPLSESDPSRDILRRSWPWFLLLGVAMTFGSIVAASIALVRVLLPYDEVFVGLNAVDLLRVNANLLAFLVHDRITLAGLMATAGIAYTGLAWFGARRGWHWAEGTIQVSAFVGMCTFFLFLGFGYFEPFHGFVTAMLAQFLIAGTRSRLDPPTYVPQPPLRETAIWRLSLWGQLCWILFGVGLLGAGIAISIVGITSVFVPEDLHFMNTTAQLLQAASPRLVPLIAHDRATVGGMLLSCGFVYLLASLWGFRSGERWLWWTHVVSGLPSFVAVLWIHLHVGYVDFFHLAPVLPALALFIGGAVLSRRFLCATQGLPAREALVSPL